MEQTGFKSKTICLILIFTLLLPNTLPAASVSPAQQDSLGIWTAAERCDANRQIIASLYRKNHLIWIAHSERYLDILKKHNAPALLLSSGRYLMAQGTSDDDLSLIRACIYEDFKMLMQKEEARNPARYNKLMKEVLGNGEIMGRYRALSDPKNPAEHSGNVVFNNLAAKAFEILFLTDNHIADPATEITDAEKAFAASVKPTLVKKDSAGRYINFSQEFFDIKKRMKLVKAPSDPLAASPRGYGVNNVIDSNNNPGVEIAVKNDIRSKFIAAENILDPDNMTLAEYFGKNHLFFIFFCVGFFRFFTRKFTYFKRRTGPKILRSGKPHWTNHYFNQRSGNG